MSAGKTEEEKLSDYASHSLRGPRYGIFEQLLCQHLVQATVTADPLRKIQLICDAALMLDQEKRRSLELDVARLEAVKAITDALQHRISTKIKGKNNPVISVEFGFNFSEENYKKYVEGWWNGEGLVIHDEFMDQKLGAIYRVFYCSRCRNQIADDLKGKYGITGGERCKFCGADLKYEPITNARQTHYINHRFHPHKDTPSWRVFFARCHVLHPTGYATLENSFLEWARPFTMELMRKLTESVRPEIYNEIAKMFLKARRQEDAS